MSETGAGRPFWPGDSGQGGRGDDIAREAVLARAFVRLADTLASDFDIVDFLHGLAEDSVEILRAAAAGVMLADARGGLLAAQLQAALNSRVIIEQAKGMIAQYLTVTVDDAFKLLRNYAHYHNRKLSEVASDVVERRIPSVALGRPHGQQS